MRYGVLGLLGLIVLVACEDGDGVVVTYGEPMGQVAVELVNGSGELLYLTGIDDPVQVFRKEGEDWGSVRAEHGCVDTCESCQAFSCEKIWCMAPREVAAGGKFGWVWKGLEYRLAVDTCAADGGVALTCLDEFCAPAGLYKIKFCYRTQPVPESDDGFGGSDCLADAGLEGVELEPAVCVEQEFEFPGEAQVVVTFP